MSLSVKWLRDSCPFFNWYVSCCFLFKFESLFICYWFNTLYETLWASLAAQAVKNQPAMWETWVRSLGWEGPLEEGMATHSSILAWRILKDRGTWCAIVCGVTKGQTQLSDEAQHSPWDLYSKYFHQLVPCFLIDLCVFNRRIKLYILRSISFVCDNLGIF